MHQVFFPIYNDFMERPRLPDDEMNVAQSIKKDAGEIINLKKKSEAFINLEVSKHVQSTQGSAYSVSIVPEWMEEQASELNNILADSTSILIPSIYKIWKYLFLKGNVIDPNTNVAVRDKYLSLYIPALGYFKRMSTVGGRIKTDLPDINYHYNIQVLSLNPNTRYPLTVEHIQSHAPAWRNQGFTLKARRTPEILTWIFQQGKKRMVEDLFSKKVPLVLTFRDSIKSFLPDKKFILKDFQELINLEEFIKEVLLDAHVTSIINNKKSLRLRHKDKNQLYRWPAWYMLDGIFQSDEDAMLHYDIAKIKSIELFQRDVTIERQFDPMMKTMEYFLLPLIFKMNPSFLFTP